MKKVAVLIPVFLSQIPVDEKKSFLQSIRVLGNYKVFLVCPSNLDVSLYQELSNESVGIELLIERFPTSFFEGIKGYNRLLLSYEFYDRFREFDYILICQLDAFVFRDELMEWCEKGYDYVGAPVFDNGFDMNDGRVGNGGFSLRRVKAYLDYFCGKKHVFMPKDIANRIAFHEKPYTRWLFLLLMITGWRNKPKSVAKRWQYNEDDFWSSLLSSSNYALKKPSVDEAMTFAFEKFPSECFKEMGRLPFGCHAWRKYQYDEFWKNYICDN